MTMLFECYSNLWLNHYHRKKVRSLLALRVKNRCFQPGLWHKNNACIHRINTQMSVTTKKIRKIRPFITLFQKKSHLIPIAIDSVPLIRGFVH